MIARDVSVALAVIVAKAPYIQESGSGFTANSQVKCGKVSADKLDKLFTIQNTANLQRIAFTLDFGFRIYGDLTKSVPFRLGFTRYICLKTTK